MWIDSTDYVIRPEGCWVWALRKNKDGYGMVHRGGKFWYAHRLMWTLEYGSIPDGQEVCHTCDNPACINPLHLFLGTHLENMKDCQSKNRNFKPTGQKNGRCKVSHDQFVTLKRAIARGISQRFLAHWFGLSRSTIYNISANRYWRHLA